MTIKRLEQYADIRREIRNLEQRIERCQKSRAFDVVLGSVGVAHAKRPIAIRGVGKRDAELAAKLRRILEARRDTLAAELLEIETFLDTVGDSKVRQIIQMHYVDGLSWAATASRVYGHPCGDRSRMRVNRFFKKN